MSWEKRFEWGPVQMRVQKSNPFSARTNCSSAALLAP